MTNPTTPQIAVLVELGSELSFLADGTGVASLDFRTALESRLNDACKELGVPGKTTVKTRVLNSSSIPQVYVHEIPQPHTRQMFRCMWESFSFSTLGTLSPDYSWSRWLSDPISQSTRAVFLSRFISEVIKLNPEVLVGTEQVLAYLQQPTEWCLQAWGLEKAERALKSLLRQRISMRDIESRIHQVESAGQLDGTARFWADGGPGQGESGDDAIERLIAQLTSKTAEILINPDYLAQLLASSDHARRTSVFDKEIGPTIRNQFGMLADRLFYNLGIRIPDICFVPTQELEGDAFAIKLNDVVGYPRLGLRPDQLLVNETVEHLDDMKALAVLDPANYFECSLIATGDRKAVVDRKLTTWDSIGYIALALAGELSQNAWRLLTVEDVKYELALLYDASQTLGPRYKPLKELVLAVMEAIPVERLTWILRGLLREGISIRDLRGILERVLTYDHILTDPMKYVVFDDRLGIHERLASGKQDVTQNYVQHVRNGLKRHICNKYMNGSTVIAIYLLDPEIEERLLATLAYSNGDMTAKMLTSDEIRRIRNAVGDEILSLPKNTVVPAILTTTPLRHAVWEMLAPEFSALGVLSYDELSPDASIQPRARISASI
jgi:hypothetical protein